MAKQKQIQQTPDENLTFYLPKDIDFKESHKNPKSCLDVIRYVDEKMCNGCSLEMGCIYEFKYNYRKIG